MLGTRATHFVGFRDERYMAAVRAFGLPDFIHRVHDKRSRREIADGDLVVFATGDHDKSYSKYSGDDLTE